MRTSRPQPDVTSEPQVADVGAPGVPVASQPTEPGPARRPTIAVRVVGVAGEVMLTLGVLASLFVVWQLWWTDVVGGRQQEAAVEEFRTSIDTPGRETQPDLPDVAANPTPSDQPPPAMPSPDPTEVFGILYVPRWGQDYAVPLAEGVDVATVLNKGSIGHYPGTAMPGQVGNFATAAHRQSFGAPYRHVEELRPGDPIIVETADGWFVYRVTEDYIVTPDRVDVVAPVPGQPGAEPTRRLITLTTCHPLYSAAQRWITHGELAEWYPRAGGAPAQLMEEP